MSVSKQLWPEDSLTDGMPTVVNSEPNNELAVTLLAAGYAHSFIAKQCGFASVRECSRFLRDSEVVKAAQRLSGERGKRIGDRALVRLEGLLATEHTDLRATVLAVRTGLEVSGYLKRDIAPPVKHVRELTVPELSQLIESTRQELNERIAQGGAGDKATNQQCLIPSTTCKP